MERNVQTVKQLLRKADECRQNVFLAVLEFRNSPISGMDESPAELLMSKKLRTKLPTSKSLLQPQPRCTSQICHNLLTRQQHQKAFCDRGTPPLSNLHEGEPVQMTREREWTPAWSSNNTRPLVCALRRPRMECRCVEIASIFSRPRRRHLQPHARHGKQ